MLRHHCLIWYRVVQSRDVHPCCMVSRLGLAISALPVMRSYMRPATTTVGLLYVTVAEVCLTIASSKVNKDELPRDGPHGLCVNLLKPTSSMARVLFCRRVQNQQRFQF